MALLPEIDTLLASLEVDVEAFAVCDVRAGWHLDAPRLGRAAVHYVLQGEGTLRAESGERLPLAPGGLLILPPGVSARISADPRQRGGHTRCKPPAAALPWLYGGGGASEPGQLLLACGTVHAAGAVSRGLFDYLATPLQEDGAAEPRIRDLLRALLDELTAPGLGSRALCGAIMKQCLILLLRRLAGRDDQRLPWLRALHDPALGPAVRQMLADPGAPLDLERLAARAHMSRSTFAARFRATLGIPPKRLLSELRLEQAARLLATSDLPVKTIAARSGYRSRSHFSRAFKLRYGSDPGAWRQRG